MMIPPQLVPVASATPPLTTNVVLDAAVIAQDVKAAAAAILLTADEEARIAALFGQPAIQANAVTAIWGDSGSGKTALVCTAIEYTWETFHKVTRYYAGDLGGYGNKLLSLARLGLVEIWNLSNHVDKFETVELATLGYWPEQILDRENGYADPYVKLVAPQLRKYTVFCANGHATLTVDQKSQLAMFQAQCPTCKDMVTLTNCAKVTEQVTRSRGFKHVGGYVYESGTSLQELIMGDMADRAGRDELGGEKGAINKIVSGSLVFGSNNRAHYGFAQTRGRQWIANARTIPDQVVPAIFTFLADRGSDQANAPVYGPKIAGGAKTGDVPSWVGNCIHTERVKDQAGTGEVWRAWLQGHRNPAEGNILYLAKHRAEPGTFVEPYLQDGPQQQPFTTFSLGYFFRKIDEGFKASIDRDTKKYPDAPALQPFGDDAVDEIVVEAPMSAASMTHVGLPAASVGGVPVTMMPGMGAPAASATPGGMLLPGMLLPSGAPVVAPVTRPDVPVAPVVTELKPSHVVQMEASIAAQSLPTAAPAVPTRPVGTNDPPIMPPAGAPRRPPARKVT